jgi:valyl-tRNA synthetase
MQSRYENWVGGLNGDWLISRQRFFGVPFPLWYRLDASGEPVFDDPLLPDEADLPIDPTSDVPAGFTADQRNQPGGFAADPDIMDTWATSSLSPQIAGGWEDDPTCSRGSSRSTCARRATTSSAPGCSPPWCAATTSTARCRGPTPRCPAGSSTRTARR